MSTSSDNTMLRDNLGRFKSDSGHDLILSATGLLLANPKENKGNSSPQSSKIEPVSLLSGPGHIGAGMGQHPGVRWEPMSLSSLFPLQSPAKKGRSDLYSISEEDKAKESTKESKKDTKVKRGEEEVKSAKVKAPVVRKEVTMSYKINCVSDISAILGTVEVDLKVFFHWTDEALIGRKNGETINIADEKGLFDPDMVITNDHNISEISSVAKITNSGKGAVKCSKHYKGSVFLTSMDLKLFPFDCQNLQICFKPYKKSIEEVLMIPSDPAECAMESRIAQEWDILGHCMKVFETDPATSSAKKVYSTIYLTVLTRRKAGWFVANIFVPTFLMLVVSWLTFIYEPHGARSDRNDVSMSTLLLSISNKFVVGDAMPKVDYRTLVDIYVDTCFYLQVLTMLANAVVEKYQDMEYLGAFGRHLNLTFFLLELIAAFCLHEWFFVSLWNHRADILDWVEASKTHQVLEEAEMPVEVEEVNGEFDEFGYDGEITQSPLPLKPSPRRLSPLTLPDSIFTQSHMSELDQQMSRKSHDGLTRCATGLPSGMQLGRESLVIETPDWRSEDGTITPPYRGYIPLNETASQSPPATRSPLFMGIMRKGPTTPVQPKNNFASSTSSFFSAESKDKRESDDLHKRKIATPRKVYQSRPRRTSSVSTLLIFIERVAGPASQWVVGEEIVSSNGHCTPDDGSAGRRIASPHFTDFGAVGMLTPHMYASEKAYSSTESRRLETTMQNERANMITEIFKGTKSDKELKDALAKRKVNVERAKAREIRNSDGGENHRQRGYSLGGSTTINERRSSYGDMTNSAHGECNDFEEDQIRDMAVRAIQARWRMIRARRQVIKLRGLHTCALMEGYATRIQRFFRRWRLRSTWKTQPERF